MKFIEVSEFPKEKKIRLGNEIDGGYIIGNIDENYDLYISAGVSNEESFSRDFINKYNMNILNSYAFDGSIDNYPYNYTDKISFIKKYISDINDENNDNLINIIKNYNNIFLKMDIEGGEYKWLLSIDSNYLNNFKQMVIEFHGINDDTWGCNYRDKIKCLEKILKTHYIIHAHGNNFVSSQNNIPDVLELTYLHKSCFNKCPNLNKCLMPIKGLDYPNNPSNPDLKLYYYPFVDQLKNFKTKYGNITIYTNDSPVCNNFELYNYFDEGLLLEVKQYINLNKNILEIGGHCGTTSLFFANILEKNSNIYVYEPQKNLYNLLLKNIKDNDFENIIKPYNKGVFCFSGNGKMNDTDITFGGNIEKRYNKEKNLECNFAGLCLGKDGEEIELTTIDDMDLDNIGFIYCCSQGSENFIFSKATYTILRYKPVILYQNKDLYGLPYCNIILNSYKDCINESLFDINEFCNKLGYKHTIHNFNNHFYTLLIP